MNISGLYWATDILNGRKPIPEPPKIKKKSEGFEEKLNEAIRKENEHGKETSRRNDNS